MSDSSLEQTYADADYGVIVIGGGPTGLTLAALLAEAGTSVALIDPQRVVCQHPRATHIDDETMRVFQMFQADDEDRFLRMLGHDTQNQQGQVVAKMAMDGPRTDQGWWSDYQFHQPDLEARLRGRLAPLDAASMWLGWRAIELIQDDAGVEVVVKDEQSGREHRLRAGYVVGADGAGSWVSKLIDAGIEDLNGTQTSLIVDIHPFAQNPELHPQIGFQRSSSTWPLIYVPIQPPMIRFEKMLRPGDEGHEHERPENVYRTLAPFFAPGSYRILRTQAYTWHAHLATQWRAGRVFLAGDAAHTMPPMLGQGMCSGLRDATNLAWKLSAVLAGQSSDALLDTYASERIPQVRPYIEVSAHLAHMIEGDVGTEVEGASAEPPEPEIHENAQFRPPLGPGLLDEGLASGAILAPQPTTDDEVRFDDLVGYHFAVYASAELVAAVDDETHRAWAQLGVVAVTEPSAELAAWTTAHGCQALIVRPDRYVYAAVADSAELSAATLSLRDFLLAGVNV